MFRCWAENYCKRYKTVYCNDYCDVWYILKALYSESNIPKIYQYPEDLKLIVPEGEKDLYNAYKAVEQYRQDILKNVEKGVGLYIYGKMPGTGKTTWACKIMAYYFRKIVFNTGIEYEGIFINVPEFLNEIKDSFNDPTPEFKRLYDKVENSKLAIFDDIGAEKPTEWVAEKLYTIINHRVNEGLTTIYTSNIDLDTLADRLGSRTVSRIIGNSYVIEFKGKDKRRVGK